MTAFAQCANHSSIQRGRAVKRRPRMTSGCTHTVINGMRRAFDDIFSCLLLWICIVWNKAESTGLIITMTDASSLCNIWDSSDDHDEAAIWTHTPSQVWVSLRISRSRWHDGTERETTTGHLQIGGTDGSGYVEEHLLLGPSMNGAPSWRTNSSSTPKQILQHYKHSHLVYIYTYFSFPSTPRPVFVIHSPI